MIIIYIIFIFCEIVTISDFQCYYNDLEYLEWFQSSF